MSKKNKNSDKIYELMIRSDKCVRIINIIFSQFSWYFLFFCVFILKNSSYNTIDSLTNLFKTILGSSLPVILVLVVLLIFCFIIILNLLNINKNLSTNINDLIRNQSILLTKYGGK